MAANSNDLWIRIKSSFSGEGFKKANNAVKGVSAQVKNATKDINGVVAALGGVDGQVGKIFGSINGIMGAFAGGGVFGLAAAGIGTAFKTVMDRIEAAKKKAEEAAKAMREAFQKMFDGLGDSISRTRGRANDRVEQGNYNTGRLSKAITREQQMDIMRIQSEGIDRRSKMTDENKKAVDLAKEELEIQKLIAKSVKEQNDLKVKSATNAYNAKSNAMDNDTKLVNDAIERFLKQQDEIDKKIDEQQKKLEHAKKYNAEGHVTTIAAGVSGGTMTVADTINTKPIEDEIKKLTEKKDELYKIKEESLSKIDLEKEQKDVSKALDALQDSIKERQFAMEEAAANEKKAQEKLNEALKKRVEAEIQANKESMIRAEEFVKAYVEQTEKDKEQKRRKDITNKIEKRQEEHANLVEKLNKELDKAKDAVKDWVSNFNANQNLDFGKFNKKQNDKDKANAVPLVLDGKPINDANGQPLALNKKQANRVKANRQILDNLRKRFDKNGDGNIDDNEMAKMDSRTKKEFLRRQAFDDMFNPQKIADRMKAEEDARKKKEAEDKKMRSDIHQLKEMLVDKDGLAI